MTNLTTSIEIKSDLKMLIFVRAYGEVNALNALPYSDGVIICHFIDSQKVTLAKLETPSFCLMFVKNFSLYSRCVAATSVV